MPTLRWRSSRDVKAAVLIVVFVSISSLLILFSLRNKHKAGLRLSVKQSPSNFEHVEITRKRKKSKILLFVGIFTAPIRQDRRKALRETWLRKCKMSTIVVCWFITDGQDVKGMRLQGEVRVKLENESRHYGDLVQAESPAGLNFGRRYLWMIEWASERYDFQYLLRLDDDYFVCFDKLIYELQHHRPKTLFTWGWLRCKQKGMLWNATTTPQ